MPAETIDQVLADLDRVIDAARQANSRRGYFAAMYRKVTARVQQGIEDGEFENPERMERLDVIFANRYLDAAAARQTNTQLTQSWAVAFDAADRWWPIVLQHLLIGMNAHINLDLGIAAAETAPGDQIDDLEGDFMHINAVLAELVQGVNEDLQAVWPRLKWLDRLARGTDDVVINFSISRARDQAWQLARRLARLDPDEREQEIQRVDQTVATLGKVIWRPGPIARLASGWIRLGERGSVSEIIDILL